MIRPLVGFFTVPCLLALFVVGSSQAATFKHVTLTGQSATGYTYAGTGTQGLPGTTNPDSRRRPKIYNDFAAFDASTVGNTLTMTYDILMGGDANPDNSTQNWRFGFVSSSANSGKGVTLGANFDLGNLAGTVAYEFFTDASVTSGLGTPPSGAMDTAFTDTLNDPADGIARIAQSNADPFNDNVSLNDRTDTHRVTLTLERVSNGYDLSFSWQNLVSGNTITHAATITTGDSDPTVAQAAAITNWDRLGFFINDDSLNVTNGPWVYTLSNVAVTGNAAQLGLAGTWSPNRYQIPEPASALLVFLAVLATSAVRGSR